MKPGYKFLFLLVSLLLILEVTHCTDEDGKHEIVKVPVSKPKNRYIVEKTQNVTEKRETVPHNADDGFQESFRKVRKVHKKLVNKKLRQYDETEDLERKRIKDSGESAKKNVEEVQHVIQKTKIVENPSYIADKQDSEVKEAATHTSEQRGKTAEHSELQNKETLSQTITQDEGKVEEGKEKVVNVLPTTETKRKVIVNSETEREEESDKVDSLNKSQGKKIISPERKGKKVIRTIYVTQGQNKHSEGEHDDLESEYAKLLKSATGKEAGADTYIIESEERIGENKESSPKGKKSIEIEHEKSTEIDETKPSLNSGPRIKTRRIIIRRPVKIIRKNITRSAKEEEQKENRREEETVVDSEVRTVPVRRRKKITTSETEKDQSKNTAEGTEDSETVIEKPEGHESVKHITIKRTRSGKDTKRSDKTNTEDVEIITDSEEPWFENKTGKISKPKRITRRIVTETEQNDADSENDAQKKNKKTVNVIDKVNSNADKNTLKKDVSEKEAVEVSTDTEKEKQYLDIHVQKEEMVEAHTEKTIPTTISEPTLKREPSQTLDTDIVDKSVPSESKIIKVSRTVAESEGMTDDKTGVKPKTIGLTKKQTKDKYGATHSVTKSKAIADIEEEIRQMLLEEKQTEKPKGRKKSKSPKRIKKTVTVTNNLQSGSEVPENKLKPIDTTTHVIETTEKTHPVLRNTDKITITEIQEDDVKAHKTITTMENLKNVEITTAAPRVVIKDKILTEVKVPKEDTIMPETNVPKLKSVDSMEPETEAGDIHESQNAVVKKIVKSETSKDDTQVTEIDGKDDMYSVYKSKPKNLFKPDIRTESIPVIETDTDKKTTVVQDIIETRSLPVKKSTLTGTETQKKEREIESEGKKQLIETDETNVIKIPPKVVKKETIRTEITKDDTAPETQSNIRPSDESETPSIVIKKTGSDAPKVYQEVSETERVTKKEPDEIGVTDKVGKLPESRSKIIKKIITTTTFSGTERDQDGSKLNLQDEKVKPAKEFEAAPGSRITTVKKVIKISPETHKEDTTVSELDSETDKVGRVKETEKFPESKTVVADKVRETGMKTFKEDVKIGEVKPAKEMEKSPESNTVIVKRLKRTDLETQKEDSEIGTENTEVKDIKETKKAPEYTKTTKEDGITPEPSTVIAKQLKKIDLQTQKEDAEVDTKVSEYAKSPEYRTTVVRKVKKADLETQKKDAEVELKTNEDDTKSHEAKTIKETEEAPESRTVIVRKVKKIDSEVQKKESEDDKGHEVKTTKEGVKNPEYNSATETKITQIDSKSKVGVSEDDTKIHEEKVTKETANSPAVVVKNEKRIDSETQTDVSEDDTKAHKVKISNETDKVPESETVIVRKGTKIDSETKTDGSEGDNKTHDVKSTKEIGKSPETNTIIAKTIRKTVSERDKDTSDAPEVDTKGKQGSSEDKFSKDIERAPQTSTVITKKVTKTDTEIQKDDTKIDTTDVVKPTKETEKTAKSGSVDVNKVKTTDFQIHKEAVDVRDMDTEKVQSGEVRISKDIDNAPKIRKIIVRTMEKTDYEAEKGGADVPEVNTAIKKHSTTTKLNDEFEKVPESRTITRKRVTTTSEGSADGTEVSDHDHKPNKQAGHTDVMEISKVIQPGSFKDHIKDGEVDKKEKQYIVSEQTNKVPNVPVETKITQETQVTNKIVEPTIEKEDKMKRTEDIQLTKQPKADVALITSHTKTSSQIEDEKDIRKDKHFGDVLRTTQTIRSESGKDIINTEKNQLVPSEDKQNKDGTVNIENKKLSALEKVSVTSEQGKSKTKAQEDLEELVEKDEIITDTQVIEEEVEEEPSIKQEITTASKLNSKSVDKVVKSEAQQFEQQTGMRTQDRVLNKGSAVQHVVTGTAGKVATGGKTIIIPKHPRRMHGASLNGREAAEFLFLLENDAEPTGPKDPSVAAELMSKLRVSKTRNYTTYHVNRGKEWSTNEDLNVLLLRLQVCATKIRSTKEISTSYLETVQQLQNTSTKYIQDGYQAPLGTQVKLQIKQFEKLQNTFLNVETSLQNEGKVLIELAVKAMCEIRSGMFKMECFKEKYPIFEKFLSPAEPDKKDCYGNVRKLLEWTKAVPELWKNKERRLNKLQGSLENLKKAKDGFKPGDNIKKHIAAVLCDIFNYMDVQAKFLNFSAKLEGVAKLARREINICNKKEPIDPALADADK